MASNIFNINNNGIPKSLGELGFLNHHANNNKNKGAILAAIGISEFACPKYHPSFLRIDKHEQNCYSCNNSYTKGQKRMEGIAEELFALFKASGEIDALTARYEGVYGAAANAQPAVASETNCKNKKTKKEMKAEKALKKTSERKAEGRPRWILAEVKRVFTNPVDPKLAHIDSTIRYQEKIDVSLFKDDSYLQALCRSSPQPIDDEEAASKTGEWRTPRKTDPREVKLLQEKVQRLVQAHMQASQSEDRETQTRRIAYCNFIHKRHGGNA